MRDFFDQDAQIAPSRTIWAFSRFLQYQTPNSLGRGHLQSKFQPTGESFSFGIWVAKPICAPVTLDQTYDGLDNN
jgi:hypothetical protein